MLDAFLLTLTNYYGLDWAAMCFGLIGLVLVTKRNSFGLIFQAIASLLGLCVAVMSDQYGFVVYNSIFMLIAGYGFYSWRHAPAA